MDQAQREFFTNMQAVAKEVAEELKVGETTALMIVINVEQLRLLQDIRREVGAAHLTLLGMYDPGMYDPADDEEQGERLDDSAADHAETQVEAIGL